MAYYSSSLGPDLGDQREAYNFQKWPYGKNDTQDTSSIGMAASSFGPLCMSLFFSLCQPRCDRSIT